MEEDKTVTEEKMDDVVEKEIVRETEENFIVEETKTTFEKTVETEEKMEEDITEEGSEKTVEEEIIKEETDESLLETEDEETGKEEREEAVEEVENGENVGENEEEMEEEEENNMRKKLLGAWEAEVRAFFCSRLEQLRFISDGCQRNKAVSRLTNAHFVLNRWSPNVSGLLHFNFVFQAQVDVKPPIPDPAFNRRCSLLASDVSLGSHTTSPQP